MLLVPVKDLVLAGSAVAVHEAGVGPASGGLWNTSILVGDVLVSSCPGRYCTGGTTVQVQGMTTGLFGPKRFITVPGGGIAWWPASPGFVTFDAAWGTGYFHPVTDTFDPLPAASFPVVTTVGVTGVPKRGGNNIAAGDITGNGHPDLLVVLKDWDRDGYHPDGKRWSNPDYRPYTHRVDDDPGRDPERDERLPFWGSRRLAPFQQHAVLDPATGCWTLACRDVFGGSAGQDILYGALPRDGDVDGSLHRTYRGRSPRVLISVFEGNGDTIPANIDEDEPSFTYAGTCKHGNGEDIAMFGDAGVAILPGGAFVTVDFVGEIRFFKKAGEGLVFEEKPVFVEGNKIPAIHGCIGTVSIEQQPANGDAPRLILSGEFGITEAPGFRIERDGLWMQSPDEHLLRAAGDFFKEDILVVPSFVDDTTCILGSGAGRYARCKIDVSGTPPSASKLAPFCHLRIQAGPVGSVQGTTEERWGYTCPAAFRRGEHGDMAVISGDISEYIWMITHDNKRVVITDASGKPARVAWRVRPAVFMMDGTMHVVTMNPRNECTVYRMDGRMLERTGAVTLSNGNVFGSGRHGGSRGRVKLEAVAGTGKVPDLLVGTCGNVDLGDYTTSHAIVARLASTGTVDDWHVDHVEIMGTSTASGYAAITFGHHSCAPATVPEGWDGASPRRGRHLVVGAEDGRLYHFKDPCFRDVRDLAT